jgi:hypothetical protein
MSSWSRNGTIGRVLSLNEDLIESIALGHDLRRLVMTVKNP